MIIIIRKLFSNFKFTKKKTSKFLTLIAYINHTLKKNYISKFFNDQFSSILKLLN